MNCKKAFCRLLVLSAAALALAACGGDGGGGGGVATNSVTKFASLSGSQETPLVTTNAGGTGGLTVDVNSGKVSGSITIVGLTANAAHVHDGATGVAGPVIIPLSETSPGSGVWAVPASAPALTAAQITDFTAGKLYFNAHTTANPNGEIRGQINVATNPLVTKFVSLSGSQEIPPVTTGASGTGSLAVDTISGKVVSGSITIVGLTANAAHVHDGATGVAGPVIIPLSETSPGSGVWAVPASAPALTAAQITDFTAGNLYFNAHTLANPAGEIRGQINLTTQPVAAVSFLAQIQPIFNANCTTSCHSPGGSAAFLNLTAGNSFASLVQSAPPKVVAGSSAASRLYLLITGAQQPQMPLGRSPLSPGDQTLIKNWIDQGAANN